MIKIDGGYGEGGGQILRTAISLSCLLKQPIEIYNIRKGRKKPGIQPQHLTSIRAAKKISNAYTEGDRIGSLNLIFSPNEIKGGDYSFDIGTAGSISLVIQTIILPLSTAPTNSTIEIIGGTHVPWSPPFHYLKEIFIPILGKMGFDIKLFIEKWGWYPIGGGKVRAEIKSVKDLTPISITERGRLKGIKGISAVSNLPLSIAERQKEEGLKILRRNGIDADIEIVNAPSNGKGTFFFLLAGYENSFAGFSALGEKGKRAEEVSMEACKEFFAFNNSAGALDPRISDQIIPCLCLIKGESAFTTARITRHLHTNIWLVKEFLPVKIEIEGKEGEEGKIYFKSY